MISLKLLGGVALEGPEGPLAGAVAQRRRLALLALLALSPTGRMSRDKLVAYLWPDSDAERARHALSNSLYIIKKALGEDAVQAASEDLSLNRELVEVDALELEAAVAAGDWERAASLYAGPLLDGVHLRDAAELEKWVDEERARIARLHAESLENLAQQAAAEGRVTEAVDWWRRLAAHDRYDSRIALALMEALAAAGNRAEAIQHARIHADLLQEELEADPDPAVFEFAERLRAETPPSVRPALESTSGTTTVAEGTARTGASRRVRPRRPIILLVASIAIIFAGTWLLRTSRFSESGEAKLGEVHSVAVLPFENISPDPTDAYFADGMHDEIIARLSQVPGLTVISRTSVMRFRGRDMPLPKIAEELRVSTILEGTARKTGNQVRITAQLIDARSDTHLWTETYDLSLNIENIFAIQAQIAEHVARAMETVLTPAQATRISAGSTDSLTAYELYLQGRQAYYRFRIDENEEAIRLFKRAIELDPEFALAWAGLADAFSQRPRRFGYPPVWFDSAEVAAQRSTFLDPSVAEGWKALGLVYTVRGWVRASMEAYQRALQLNPSLDDALNNLGMSYFELGDYGESLRYLKRASRVAPYRGDIMANISNRYIDLGELGIAERWIRTATAVDPTAPGVWQTGLELKWAQHEHVAAVREAEAGLQRVPSSAGAHQLVAQAAGFARDYDKARYHVGEAIRLVGPSSVNPYLAGAVYLLTGDTAAADPFFARAEAQARARLDGGSEVAATRINLAMTYAARGDTTEALRWLEEAYSAGERRSLWIEINPLFDALRDLPEYRSLIGRMRAEVEAMRRQVEQEEIAEGER